MELWVQTRADGLAVAGDSVFWSVGCGDDFTPSRSEVGSRSWRDGSEQWLYRPTDCQPDRVASASIAVDETNVYWLTGDGQVVSMSRQARSGTPTALCAMLTRPSSGWPRLHAIAVGGDHVYWTEASSVYKVPKSGGSAQLLTAVPVASELRQLTAGGDDHLLCMAGHRLIRIDLRGEARARIINEYVTCFAVGGGRLAWASAVFGSGITQVWSTRLSGDDVRNHYQTDGTINTSQHDAIDALAIDGESIYAHERRHATTGGPIVRIPLAGGGAAPITEHMPGNVPLVLGGQSLFFTDFNSGIYRVDTGAAPLSTTVGRVWITGAENVQTVQTVDGRIPLIAAKRTFVRVYVQSREDDRGPWRGVTARLTVAGFARSHSPVNSYTITASPTGSDRRTLNDSFVFELDPEETAAGARSYNVTLVPPPGRPTDQPTWPQQRFPIEFKAGGPARLMPFYGVRYKYHNVPNSVQQARGLSGPDWGPRDWTDFELDRRNAEGYLPVASLQLRHWPGDPTPSFDYTGTGNDEGYIRARAWAERLMRAQRPGDTVKRIVILQPEADGYMGECFEFQPGKYRINYQTWRGDEGNTLAHELAHSLELRHTPDLMGYGGGSDARYPRSDGSFGPEVGFCCEPRLQVVAGSNADGSTAVHDVMSYTHRQQQPGSWTSPYSYCKAMNASTGGGISAAGIDGYRP